MNRLLACEVLDLDPTEDLDEQDIKRQYRRKALLNHPDKNPHQSTEATQTFQEIHEAYQFLLLSSSSSPTSTSEPLSYQDMLFEYMTSLFSTSRQQQQQHPSQPHHCYFQDVATQLFYTIAKSLTSKCEETALSMLERMDRATFVKVYKLLKKCGDVLLLPEEWKEKMESLHQSKTEQDHIIVLQPRLEDLFDDNVFRLTIEGQTTTFYIPLWHHELVYDRPGSEGGELTVQCVPTLSSNMTLDEHNNLQVHIRATMVDFPETLEIPICAKKTVTIERKMLYLRDYQRVTFKGEGIAKVHERNIYDVSKRADIVVHVRFV
jgi:hypothetical protein